MGGGNRHFISGRKKIINMLGGSRLSSAFLLIVKKKTLEC